MIVARHQSGFTLIELLLSISIIGIMGAMSLPLYNSFVTRNELALTTETTASMLRRAGNYARGSSGDSQWSVRFQAGVITLFKGASFSGRDAAFDEPLTVANNISSSFTGDVTFAKLTGFPTTATTIVLTGPEGSKTVTINAKGAISY